MTNRTNKSQNEQIIADLANSIVESFYSNKSQASGNDLLGLFPVRQVNLFVLQSLFEKWNEETGKFKSGYFNFSSIEVKKAFETFKNTLSRNILIEKDSLRPLLQIALTKSIQLYTDPSDFKKKYPLNRENSRFIKTYEEFLLQNGHTPDEKSIQKNRNAFQQAIILFGGPAIWTDEPEVKPKSEISAEPDSIPSSGGGLKTETKSILNASITLNQRIMFTKVLFMGNKEDFDVAIEMIDTFNDFDEALEFVKTRCADPNSWDFESDEVAEFLELLEKRFA